jgi:hypothetical protein
MVDELRTTFGGVLFWFSLEGSGDSRNVVPGLQKCGNRHAVVPFPVENDPAACQETRPS